MVRVSILGPDDDELDVEELVEDWEVEDVDAPPVEEVEDALDAELRVVGGETTVLVVILGDVEEVVVWPEVVVDFADRKYAPAIPITMIITTTTTATVLAIASLLLLPNLRFFILVRKCALPPRYLSSVISC